MCSSDLVILTSNRTRELHDALKRRCLYNWIGFPSVEREVDIVRARIPGVSEKLATSVVQAVNKLREMELEKAPGVAETLDWVESLQTIGATDLTEDALRDTIGSVLKDRDDFETALNNVKELVDSD